MFAASHNSRPKKERMMVDRSNKVPTKFQNDNIINIFDMSDTQNFLLYKGKNFVSSHYNNVLLFCILKPNNLFNLFVYLVNKKHAIYKS